MIIRNVTKKSIISAHAKYATTFKDRLFGLLIRQNSQALVFQTRFGVHTLGMQKALDIIILDRLHRVVKIKKNLSPNKFLFWNPKFMWVIELPKGAISKSWTTIGDQIYFDMRW